MIVIMRKSNHQSIITLTSLYTLHFRRLRREANKGPNCCCLIVKKLWGEKHKLAASTVCCGGLLMRIQRLGRKGDMWEMEQKSSDHIQDTFEWRGSEIHSWTSSATKYLSFEVKNYYMLQFHRLICILQLHHAKTTRKTKRKENLL